MSLQRRVLTSVRRVRPAQVAVVVAALLLIAAGGVLGSFHGALRDTTLTPSPSPSPGASTVQGSSPVVISNAGAKNIVQVTNTQDGTLRSDGRVQLTQIGAPSASPVNIADALSACSSHCQTLAVALQINLLPEVTSLAPANVAAATNAGCSGCDTVALAYQYNIRAAEQGAALGRAEQLVAAMRIELNQLSQSSTSLAQAEAGVAAVIAQFQDLAVWLITQRDEKLTPDASPAPSPSPAASPAASSSPSASPQPSPSPSSSPSPAPSPSPS